MYINKVISFKNSWDVLRNNNLVELTDMMSALDEMFLELGKQDPNGDERKGVRELWEKSLYDRGWELIERTHFSPDGKRINVGRLGPIKKGISASYPLGPIDHLTSRLLKKPNKC